MKTVYVVTPVLNAVNTIDRTIISVVTQAGDFFIRYHIQDGRSSDGTLERIGYWNNLIKSRNLPIQCAGVEFSYTSEADEGMYDALYNAFCHVEPGQNNFMTWINADDMLNQGAFALVAELDRQFSPSQISWVGGAASVYREHLPVAGFDSPIPSSALKYGLCDGKYWNFLQQEGIFFRRWLWDAINPLKNIKPFRLAGDWNLWRLFAENASLVQTKLTLGTFRVCENQLSAKYREKYMSEIDSILPQIEREKYFKKLLADGGIFRRVLKAEYSSACYSILNEDLSGTASHNYTKVFGVKPESVKRFSGNTLFSQGAKKEVVRLKAVNDIFKFERGVASFDDEWQFPAITEKQAYLKICELGLIPEGVIYVAFPWATLIDKVQTKSSDAAIYIARFREFCGLIPEGGYRVTVCQHIKMREFTGFLKECGINEVFWSHALKKDVSDAAIDGIKVSAFPLFPVQVCDEKKGGGERDLLFSFVGARSNKYYLTDSRNLIIDFLSDCPDALVVGRDNWHYNKIVYEHQIKVGGKDCADNLVDTSASEEFRRVLDRSIFSLCPSGSGPNSIRLWESIGSGVIPVILADIYAPPGNQELWKLAAVFCEENLDAIRALPERLREIASDKELLLSKRNALKQLWMLYGPGFFIYDIQVLFFELASRKTGKGSFLFYFRGDSLISCLDVIMQQEFGVEEARFLLNSVSTRLLTSTELPEIFLKSDKKILPAVEKSVDFLGKFDSSVQRFEHVVNIRNKKMVSPYRDIFVNLGARKKISLFGRHSNRTPFYYSSIRNRLGDSIEYVDDPSVADVVVTGFSIDFRDGFDELVSLKKAKNDVRFLVLSEEPLWDTVWSGGVQERCRFFEKSGERLDYFHVNHGNSDVFDFSVIPYFLLTSETYLSRYIYLLSRQIARTVDDLLDSWQKAKNRWAFVAEYRDDPRYSVEDKKNSIFGLSNYRSKIVKSLGMSGGFCEGKGWGGGNRRQDLPDWHLDKLAKLDSSVFLMSALENTHVSNYISEKIFDALAIGAFPIYYADASHRVFSFMKENAFLNLDGLSPAEAAEKIGAFSVDRDHAAAWLSSVDFVYKSFLIPDIIDAEFRRLSNVLISTVQKL